MPDEERTDSDHANASGSAPQRPAGPTGPGSRYPTAVLCFLIVAASVALAVVWIGLRSAFGLSEDVFRGGLLGLLAATLAHLGGTGFGALLAPSKGLAAAYLASTVVRFLATPILALSLYSLLPLTPQPVLIGSAVAYLLILVVDVGAMMKWMRRS
jgi:hypothetical protein